MLGPGLVVLIHLAGFDAGSLALEAAHFEELAQRILLAAVLMPCLENRSRDLEDISLPGETAAHQPGQDAAGFRFQGACQPRIALAFVGQSWLIDKAQREEDWAEPIPEGGIPGVGMRLMIGQ